MTPILRAAAIIGTLLLAACASERTTTSPKDQPADVKPIKLIPAIDGAFVDTDANKYRDCARLFVYILGDAPRYQLPIKTPGEFALRLEDVRGKTVAEWRFDAKQTAAAQRTLPPGPGFVFDLDLRDSSAATDRIERSEADLIVTFTPKEGEPISARTTAPILIGPIMKTPLK